MKAVALLRWLTVEQWAHIDRDHRRETEVDWRTAVVLVSVAISMVLPRYFGSARFITSFPEVQSLFQSWEHPGLYPLMYWALFKLVNYLLVPALVIKLVLRERLIDQGLTGTHDRRIWLLYLAMLAVVMPLVWYVSDDPAFLSRYPKYAGAAGSWEELILFELSYGLQFFLLEYFFRGYTLFALARWFGHAAIFVMVVPYTMIHFGKALPETLGSIIAGIALGTLSLRTRSIYGGVIIHCAVAWSMDGFAMWHKGELGKLLAGN